MASRNTQNHHRSLDMRHEVIAAETGSKERANNGQSDSYFFSSHLPTLINATQFTCVTLKSLEI
jgi:hypothetical protein